MFVLQEGPRHGQLVDELPDGYAPAEMHTQTVVIFGDYVARRAVWAQHRRPFQADAEAPEGDDTT